MSDELRFPLNLLELDLELDLPEPAGAPEEAGMPQDRAARIAARRAFVEMKQLFLSAAEGLPGHKGTWLGRRIRAAADAGDLASLRGPLLAALREDDARTRALRAELYRNLDGAFQDGGRRAGLPASERPSLPEAWQIWSGDVRTSFGALR
jgi:hypothetical protein